MKNSIIYIILITLLFGCEDPDKYFKELLYVADKNYPGNILNIKTFNGYKRFKINYTLPPNGNVDRIILISSLNDTTYFKISPEKSGQEDSIIIDNLKETNYTYKIASLNKENTSSKIQTFYLKVYGDYYKSSLTNLILKSYSKISGTNDLRLIFVPNYSGILTKSCLEYINNDGNLIKHNTLNPSDTIILRNYKNGSDIFLQQGYLPNISAFDTVYTEKSKLVLQ